MNELKSVLEWLLTAVHSPVHFNRAPRNADIPYVTYPLGPSFMVDEQEIWPMEVDVWDVSASDTEVDRIAREIADTLHRYRYIGPELAFKIYRVNRLAPEDDEPRVKRRQIVFQIRTFDLIKRTGE